MPKNGGPGPGPNYDVWVRLDLGLTRAEAFPPNVVRAHQASTNYCIAIGIGIDWLVWWESFFAKFCQYTHSIKSNFADRTGKLKILHNTGHVSNLKMYRILK